MESINKDNFLLTKIVATLGPASRDTATITSLIDAGASVFRINFSHGSFDEYASALTNVRKAGKKSGKYVAVIGDLSGPKIRVGEVPHGGIMLYKDNIIRIQEDPVKAYKEDGIVVLSSTFPGFISQVKTGEKILLDDGNILLECTNVEKKDSNSFIECRIIHEGLVSTGKGINLPDTDLNIPSLTPHDHKCIDFAVKNKFDYLAQSFVRNGNDVVELKDILRSKGARPRSVLDYSRHDKSITRLGSETEGMIPVIAKIEKPQALENLEDIIDQADAIMVARGDLGVEMDLAEITVHQKRIIDMCYDGGTPVIVATQMLQSMIDSPVPTRAEVSDVANAIYDGADAVMLSGETAVGKYPLETVKMMRRIAMKTCNHLSEMSFDTSIPERLKSRKLRTATIAHAVKTIVDDLDVKYIIVWSQLGGMAVYLSQQRMPKPVLMFSSVEERLRLMSLLFGLIPCYMEQPGTSREFLTSLDEYLLSEKLAKEGEAVVVVFGEPVTEIRAANTIKIHYIKEVEE